MRPLTATISACDFPRAHPAHRVRRTGLHGGLVVAAAASLAVAISGCLGSGSSSDDGGGGGGGGGGGNDFALSVVAPGSGDVVNSLMEVSVTGKKVVRVVIEMDGNLVHDDPTPPFVWTLDPDQFRVGLRTITIIAWDARANEKRRSIEFVVARRPVDVAEVLAAIDALEAGHWLELPNSHLRDVAWNDPTAPKGDVQDVITAASGGAFDTKRNILYLFGGGDDYAGNEIYGFKLEEARWERVTDPSPFPPGEEANPRDLTSHADNAPVSRHTYDTLAYIPDPVDRFYVGGGAALWRNPNLGDDTTYLFDYDTRSWTRHPDTPSVAFGSVCAVGPDARVWQHGGANARNFLSVFDPAANAWTRHVQFHTWYDYYTTAEIDPVRNLFVAVGNNTTFVWDLEFPDVPAVELATTGDNQIELAAKPCPGLAFHPPSGKMIAWNGGKDVYVLDLDAATWTLLPGPGTVDPGPQATRGTYGRFAYVPSRDIFIQTSGVDRSVYVYRLAELP